MVRRGLGKAVVLDIRAPEAAAIMEQDQAKVQAEVRHMQQQVSAVALRTE